MRDKILAVTILVAIIICVVANDLMLKHKINETISDVESIDVAKNNTNNEAESIFNDFMQREKYISLTVSHEDMTWIEECFAELISYISMSDTVEAEAAKSRLLHALKHLRRLSGFNIDSII